MIAEVLLIKDESRYLLEHLAYNAAACCVCMAQNGTIPPTPRPWGEVIYEMNSATTLQDAIGVNDGIE